ncbi:hypothetical protein HPP92_025112 [Vanilla planifolia]|uniref:Cation/H+ exchanger domain-containing protein n=1 Tax=Vanilla planifolia TaxID=51239 RepID=A0A835PJB5_VANPL|nr:hypothetical protein HPP92_025112 [Vanilla planifolia]
MLLGRSGLCRFRKFQEVVFPKRSWIHLDNISMLAFVLFTFVVAVKTDLSMVRKSGKKAIAIAQISTVLPFLLVFFVATFVSTVRTDVHAVQYTLNFAARWALTSNIVICFLLAEFKLLTSKLGRLAMSASLIADFQCVIISSTFLFLNTCIYQSIFVGMTFFFSFIGFVAGIWLFARPIVIWIIRRTPEGSAMDEGFFLCILLMAIGSSFAAELLGQSVTLGPLLLGVVIPGGPPLGTAVVDRLERLVSAIFLPVFLIIAGLRSNVDDVLAGKLWMPIAYLILLSVVAKLFGVFVPCLYCRMSLRDTFVLSLILNSRGIIEINTFNNLEDFNKMSGELYTINILGIVIVGGTTAVLLKVLYRPSRRLVHCRRRTVQACAGVGELRLLTCVHTEDNVPPLFTLVDAIFPTPTSPLCVYLLHLSPLVGRSNTIFGPYKKKRQSKSSFRALSTVPGAAVKSSSSCNAGAATLSDRIVNSFLPLERQHASGLLTIQPFVSVSPYATMHDDVCSLAADKMVDIILVPFHRRIDIDVPLHSVNPAMRAVNTNVLLYAPCSVAILVDRGLAGGPACALGAQHARRVAVFFLGGADDREALAVAGRMIEHPCIGLHVVRFVLPYEKAAGLWGKKDEDEMADEEAVEEFRMRCEGYETVEYREEKAGEGADVVGVMREMSEFCCLLVVGRGDGRESPFTAGLEMWSEYPELGVIGDILASPDFEGKASVLVVQQRSREVGGGVGRDLKKLGSGQRSQGGSMNVRVGKEGQLLR